MQQILKHLKNMQIIVCAAVILLLAVALYILFSFSIKDNFATVQTELVNLSDNIRNHYKAKPDYWGLNNASVLKNNIAPETIVKNKKIISTIGREFVIGQNENGDMVMPSQRSFMITMSNLSKTACHKLVSFDWAKENHLALQKILLNNGTDIKDFEWGSENPLPIKEDIAKSICSNKNAISWVFE